MKKVFLCAPLESIDQNHFIQQAMNMGESVLSEYGFLPVIPHIVASFLDLTQPKDRELYKTAAKELLWFCDEVWVTGNCDSEFMGAQIALAKALNIRLRYSLMGL